MSRFLIVLITVGVAAALIARPAAAKHHPPFNVQINLIFGEVSTVDGFLILTDRNQNYPRPIGPRSLEVHIAPTPAAIPDVAWTATGGVRLRIEPGFPGGAFGLPPMPSTAVIDRAGFVGPFAVTAALGAPVNLRVTLPGFAYERVSLGCASGDAGGVRIDRGGAPIVVARSDDADVFITGPVIEPIATWDQCSPSYHDVNATRFTLHAPGGAVDVTAAVDFPAVSAHEWRGPASTSFAIDRLIGTLLWRTRDGRLMKTFITPVGGTLRKNPACVFDDENTPFTVPAGARHTKDGYPLECPIEVEGATLAADANDSFADNAVAEPNMRSGTR